MNENDRDDGVLTTFDVTCGACGWSGKVGLYLSGRLKSLTLETDLCTGTPAGVRACPAGGDHTTTFIRKGLYRRNADDDSMIRLPERAATE